MKIQKSETEYSMRSLRFLLLTITTMFIAVAAMMIVMGISVYSLYHDFSFVYESARSGRFLTPSILVVLIGVIMMVVTCFGFFGTLMKSTCLVNLYAVILSVVLILEIIVVVLLFTMNPATLYRYIDIPTMYYTSDVEIEKEVDYLQSSLNCCGSDTYLEYVGQPYTYNHSTVIFDIAQDGNLIVKLPETCCNLRTETVCLSIWPVNCKNAIVNLIVQNASVLGVLGVSVMFIQILGITFALLLARCIRKYKSEKSLLKWKACEQRIITAQKIKEETKEEPTVFIEPQNSSAA